MITRSEEEWIAEYKRKGALFIHDDNPKRPHPILRGGEHSNGFFYSKPVIEDEDLLNDAASDLIESHYVGLYLIDCVVGPQTGATKLAECLADKISVQTGKECFSLSPRKGELNGERAMLFEDEEAECLKNKMALLCEDVTTTGGSLNLASDAVKRSGGYVKCVTLALVNRSGLACPGDRFIAPLINRHMPKWASSDCPLCALGSKPLENPKLNWDKLTREY